MRETEILFAENEFRGMMRATAEEMCEAIDELTDSELMDDDIDTLIDRMVASHTLVVPNLNVDDISVDESEVEVEVDDRRYASYGLGPQIVKATQYEFFIPFDGEREAFFCTPSSRDYSPPYGDVLDNEIVVAIVNRDNDVDAAAIRKRFDAEVAKIIKYLGWLRNDAAQLPTDLRQLAATRIEQRREKRKQDVKVVDGLGFRKRSHQP